MAVQADLCRHQGFRPWTDFAVTDFAVTDFPKSTVLLVVRDLYGGIHGHRPPSAERP